MRLHYLRFVIVGSFGFAIDAGFLALMIAAGSGLYAARALSFPVAVVFTWFFNRRWTFQECATNRPSRELAVYFLVQVLAALANFLVYVALLRLVFDERLNMAVPALAVGAAVGLVINFAGSRSLVFLGRKVPLKKHI